MRQQIPQRLRRFGMTKTEKRAQKFDLPDVTTGCAKAFRSSLYPRVIVIPTEGRNLLALDTAALRTTADSSTGYAVSE
jgi:hypothetical protein